MKKYIVCTWILALSLVYTHAQVATSDSLALVALYNSTNGQYWTDNTHWLQLGHPVSTWYGIYINTSGDHVNAISLENNNLTGHLPAAMIDLPELEYLMLYHNGITGTIPEEIGNLSNLDILDLSSNQLTGEIPPQLGMLNNLTILDLSENDLIGAIPVSLCNLVNLLGLYLCYNHLSGNIPSQIDNLTNLITLYLSDNNLYDPIPAEIGNLTNLLTLKLDSNHLSGPIPTQIGNLVNLQYLNLESNEFTGSIPNDICNLTGLINLKIDYNYLSGSLPSGLTSIPPLTDLEVQMNYFTFSDLEPLAGNTILSFEYSPQRQIPISPLDTVVPFGDDLMLDISTLAIPDIIATNNHYQWGKDGTYITSPDTSPTLNLDDIEYSSQGYYYCRITNSDFPLLNLTTDSIAVWVETLPNDINIYDTMDDEHDVLEGLKIYPNPTHGRVWINLPSEIAEYTLEIYNGTGNRLTRVKMKKGNAVDLTPYPAGTYFLTFKTNNQCAVYKIIKR